MNDELKLIYTKLDDIEEQGSRIDRDLVKDRHDLEQFNIRLASTEKKQEQILSRMTDFEIKMKDSIRDAIKPLTKQLEAFTNKKKVVQHVRAGILYDFMDKLARRKGVRRK